MRHILTIVAVLIAQATHTYGQQHPGTSSWDGHFGRLGIYGQVHAVAADASGNVFIGGQFNIVNDGSGNKEVRNIVRWDGESFHSVGGGIQGKVYALAVDDNGNLYAGGSFSRAWQDEAVSIPAHNMARWDGQWWHPLGHPSSNSNGLDNSVATIEVIGETVYAGGSFSNARQSDGTSIGVSNIAGWRGGQWFDLEGGVSSSVNTLAAHDGILYAGGSFSSAGGVSLNSIARWDGTEWSALAVDPGPGVVINALDFCTAGTLYAGGTFLMIGGVFTFNVALFDGTSWSAMDDGAGSFGTRIHAIKAHGSNVYVAGSAFTEIGGMEVNHIARWNGYTWSPLGTHGQKPGVRGGFLDGWVMDLAITDRGIYAGGVFSLAGEQPASNIARWDSDRWHSAGSGSNQGPDGSVNAIAVSDHGIFAAGQLTSAGSVHTRSGLAWWDGEHWHDAQTPWSGGLVHALTSHDQDIYAGGSFSMASQGKLNRIARFDGVNWHGLGRGLQGGVNAAVRAIAVDEDGQVYAGGDFNRAVNQDGSTVNVSHIARWDGERWHALDAGLNDRVHALHIIDGELYAGGMFRKASGKDVNFIARWDGQQWHDLNGGTNLTVIALASDETGSLYAGGMFSVAGGKVAPYVARWDGTGWDTPGGGLTGIVNSLVYHDGTLYAGGIFPDLFEGIAWWRGGRWQELDNGVSFADEAGWIQSLAAMDNTIFMGGQFLSAGEIPSYHFASWTGDHSKRYHPLSFMRSLDAGMAIVTGSEYELTWNHAEHVSAVRLEARYGDSSNPWTILADSLPAETGSYLFDAGPDEYARVNLRISNLHQPGIWDESGPFMITDREEVDRRLRIAVDEGVYRIFTRSLDAWSFENRKENLWPHRRPFPDWGLFCDAMGDNFCYNSLRVPRRSALLVWGIMQVFGWCGSCSGFSATSLMFFNDYYSVPATFPGHRRLYDVPVNPPARHMINKNQIRMLAPLAGNVASHKAEVWNDTPVETLEKLMDMLDRDGDHTGLVIMDPDTLMKIHTIVPIRVQQHAIKPEVEIEIYENNAPDRSRFITIDLEDNTWTYRSYHVRNAKKGIFLTPGTSFFYELEEKYRRRMVPLEEPEHLFAYASPGSGLMINNRQGNHIGMLDDNVFHHTLWGAVPMLISNTEGVLERPPGYLLPVDEYRFVQHHYDEDPSFLSVVAGGDIYSSRNLQPRIHDREIIRLGEGMTVHNPDPVSKPMELDVVTSRDLDERQYLVQNLVMAPDDSLQMRMTGHESFQIINTGSEKQYDLRIYDLMDQEQRVIVDFKALSLLPNARYQLETGRNLLQLDSLRIFIDTNLDGFFNDSLRVIGVITSAEDVQDESTKEQASEYMLYQNYPNPFNHSTIIRFDLPAASMVALEVYNTLGQHVATIRHQEMPAGRHEVIFDASGLSSGLYIYRLRTDTHMTSRKMMLIR